MNIYEALKKDHVAVKQLLSELVALDEEKDEKRRHFLIEEIRDALVPHSRAEESVLYNSMRAISSANDVVLHGFTEHMEAEALLRTLQLKDKIDFDWKRTAKKLQHALQHHIQEEEGKIFNIAQQLFTDQEAIVMGEAFASLKPEIKKEGFVKTTIDMVVNMMPPRIAASLRTYNLNPPS